MATDTVIVCEVMVEAMDRAWWRDYLEGLEARFQQHEVLTCHRSEENLTCRTN